MLALHIPVVSFQAGFTRQHSRLVFRNIAVDEARQKRYITHVERHGQWRQGLVVEFVAAEVTNMFGFHARVIM